MSSASIRVALRSARVALVALQAGWEEAVRQRDSYSVAGIEVPEPQRLAHERMQRTVVGQQLVVGELERFADLRSELAVSVRRHASGFLKHGPEWFAARLAEDLKL